MIAATVIFFVPVVCSASDERFYEKKTSWHETLRAARENLHHHEEQAAHPLALPDLGASDFTLMAWIRTTAGGTIIAKASSEGPWNPKHKAWFVREGKLCFDIGWVGCITSARTVNDGQWHHVAVTGNGREQHLYVDGQADAEGRLNGEPDPPDCVFKVGDAAANFPVPNAFNGSLDEVRVYNRVLSPKEVARSAASPGEAPRKGLVAYWSFDGNGADSSGAENNAVSREPLKYKDGKCGSAVILAGKANPFIVQSATGKRARAALWKQTEEDFADPVSRLEMGWEQEARIWEKDWIPGDYGALVEQYCQHTRHDPRTPSATEPQPPADETGLAAARTRYLAGRRDALVREKLGGINLQSTRNAIVFLNQQYPDAYPSAVADLARLDDAERKIAETATTDIASGALDALAAEMTQLQHEALVLKNPLLAGKSILFNKRDTFQSSHYYTDFIDGFERFGSTLCALSLDDGTVKEVVRKEGIIGRYDLSFDAKRVLFDYKNSEDSGFRICEAGLDGAEHQVTRPPADEEQRIRIYRHAPSFTSWAGRPAKYFHYTDDLHPCYLPDGGICFVSTRCQYGILCDGPDYFSTTVLYRADIDGGHVQKLTNSSVSESAPSVMNDGRILYTRWEYVDKGAVSVKCLWAVRPDGSGSVEIFGNDIDFPDTCNQGRAIPGGNNALVYIGAPHMPLGVGTVIRIDTNYPIRTRRPMTYITPEVDVRQEWGFNHDRNGEWVADANGPLYMDAFPLSKEFFLAACNPDKPWNDVAAYGIYLVDAFGNRVEIYRDLKTSCWQPMLLEPRNTPPVLPTLVSPDAPSKATLLMTDVYQGLTGVERGTIKYLRIMEQVPRPWSARRFWNDADVYDQQHAVISKDTHLGLKVLHGIVPVEADGSAYFVVPSDKNLFFQALDEDFMEVQRMRTYVNLRPGETRSCIGCHEQREMAPAHQYPLALNHTPAQPGPQPGEKAPRPLHYPTDVQPILDKHCVSCHSGAEPKAGLDLSGEMTALFNRSYENILGHGLVKVIGENHPKTGNIAPVPPRTLGSHASKLAEVIKRGHKDQQLSREEFCTLVTWIDSNAQYYGSYYGRRHLKYKAYPDFRPVPTFESASSIAPDVPPFSPRVFIEGETRHPFIVTDHSNGGFDGSGSKVRKFSADGAVEWEYPSAANVHEIWVLPNDNILFTANGVKEITPNKEIVFEYKSDLYLTACQRLPDGNTLIGENPLNRIVEVDPQGRVVKTVVFKTSCEDKSRQFRLVRKLKDGHYLVAHEGEGVVREYGADGTVLKEFPTPGGPYVAVRLEDGNTLIACGAGKQAIEVDPNGAIIWNLKNGDIPGIELNWMSGLQRLPNGNTVLTCWFPGDQWKGASTPQIMEVTRDKKIVWTFSSPDLIGSANNIQILDVPGDVTAGEILR